MSDTDETTTTSQPAPAAPKKASIWHRLYNGETSFDFVGNRNKWFIGSGIVILIGLLSLFTRGLNLGIDFKGGTAWEYQNKNGVSVSDVRSALREFGLAEAKIEALRGSEGAKIRVQADITGKSAADKADEINKVRDKLAKQAGVSSTAVSVNDVGPSWGHEVTKKAERALVFFFIAIA